MQAPAVPPTPRFAPLPQRPPGRIFRSSVWAFVLRDLKSRYLTTRLGLLWAVADPAAVLFIFVAIHGVISGEEGAIHGASSAEFFFWGVLPYFMFAHAVSGATGAIRASQGLLSYRQIQPMDVVIARVLIEWAVLMLVAVLTGFGWWLAGNEVEIDDWLGVELYLMALALIGFAYGFLAEVVSTVVPDMRRIFGLSMRPMLFISGLFFTMDMIPWGAEKYLVWNPVLHFVDLARGAALKGYDSPGDPLYALLCTLGLLAVGLALYRRFRDQLI